MRRGPHAERSRSVVDMVLSWECWLNEASLVQRGIDDRVCAA
jgi:hypothetical protein